MARNLVNLESVSKALRHPRSCSTASRSASPRATGSASSAATAAARRRCCGCSPRPRRRTPAGSRTPAGCGSACSRSDDDARPGGDRARTSSSATAPAHEWAGDARVREVLDGLFGALRRRSTRLDRVVGPLSGGERRRVALAALLVGEHDLLVLDEPTNHLDVEGVAWLAAHLAARREALVVVTHDRWFLDAVCTATWEVHGGAVHAYEGGYSAYVLARAERDRIAGGRARRGGRTCCARSSPGCAAARRRARRKPRFRIDAANALIADEPPPRDGVELMRFASARLGKTVYDVRGRHRRGRRPGAARPT